MHLTLILYPLMVLEASPGCTVQIFPRRMGRTSKLLFILQNPAHSSRPLRASAPSGARCQPHVPHGNRMQQATLPAGCTRAHVPTRLDPCRHALALPHPHRPRVPGNPRCTGSLLLSNTPRGCHPGTFDLALPSSMENCSNPFARVPPSPALGSNVPSSESPS